MDFLETTRLLMDLMKRYPNLQYSFDEYAGEVVIRLRVADSVPNDFEQAAKMFEPV